MSFGIWVVPANPHKDPSGYGWVMAGWLLDPSSRGIKEFSTLGAAATATVSERERLRSSPGGPWTLEVRVVGHDAQWDDRTPR